MAKTKEEPASTKSAQLPARILPIKEICGLPILGTLELQVMQLIWRREESGEETTTVRGAFREMFGPDNDIAFSTVMTMFYRLNKKGWLERVSSSDKAFHYRSTRSRQEVGRELLEWVEREFLDGSLSEPD